MPEMKNNKCIDSLDNEKSNKASFLSELMLLAGFAETYSPVIVHIAERTRHEIKIFRISGRRE